MNSDSVEFPKRVSDFDESPIGSFIIEQHEERKAP